MWKHTRCTSSRSKQPVSTVLSYQIQVPLGWFPNCPAAVSYQYRQLYALALRVLRSTPSVNMIIAIAFVCFAFGFLTAIVVASNPTKSRKDVVGLSDWLRVLRNDVSSVIDSNCGNQQPSTEMVAGANKEDGGLLSKYVPACWCNTVWSSDTVPESRSKRRMAQTAGKASPIKTLRLP